jgi:hypothetical protein
MTTRKCRRSSDATEASTKFQRIQWARKALRRMVLQMAQNINKQWIDMP